MSFGSVPLPNLSRVTESFSNLEPFIFALLLMSSLTIEPFTMFAELIVKPAFSKPSANLLLSMFALALMSALTIVSSLISVEVTCPSFISALSTDGS